MGKVIALLLVLGMIVPFGGCAVQAEPPVTETNIMETAESSAQSPAETQTALEGNLFLTVSSITFSQVGESEDVYLGLIPREQVTWESENPDVISVENGVLTAVGVGTTVIHASYGQREISCTAGCLARTQEELDALDAEILSAPKRLPPDVDLSQPCTYFDNSAILGVSITSLLMQEESKQDYLGNMTFVARYGISILSLVRRYKNLYFQGREMHVEDIVAAADVERVYLMLGCLDFQFSQGRIQLMDNWEIMLDRIAEKAPDTEIVIITNIPGFTEETEPSSYNVAVADATTQLKQLAADRGYAVIDLGRYVQDHYGRMPAVYCYDEFHMNGEGSLAWIKLLRFYARFEQEGGNLSSVSLS